MTNNNNYKKTILTALLIVPLLTAGVTVGNLQQAHANGETDFEMTLTGVCGPFAPSDLSMNVDVLNIGSFEVLLDFDVTVMNSGGDVIFSDNSITEIFLLPGDDVSVEYLAGLEEVDTYFAQATVTDLFSGEAITDILECTLVLPPPPPPEEQIEGLIADVEALDLNHGNTNSLVKKLANAIKNITNEDPTDDSEACEKLQSFIDQLNAFVNAEKLELSEVENIQNTAHQLIWDLCVDT